MIPKIKYLLITVVFALFLASCATKITSENEEEVLGAFIDRENWLKKIEKDPMKNYSFYKEEDLNIIHKPSIMAGPDEPFYLRNGKGVYTNTGFYLDAREYGIFGYVKLFYPRSPVKIDVDFQMEWKVLPVFGDNPQKKLLEIGLYSTGPSYIVEINDNGDDKSVFLLKEHITNRILFSQEMPYKNEEMLITIRKKGNQLSFFCNKKWIENIRSKFEAIYTIAFFVDKGNQLTIKDFCLAELKK